MPNSIVEGRYQLAILFGQIVKGNGEKYGAFSQVGFLKTQFHELLGYPLHFRRSNADIKKAANEWYDSFIELPPRYGPVIGFNPRLDNTEKKYGPIQDWDTSAVTDMTKLFEFKYHFKGDLRWWNTSAVTDMSFMFHQCTLFKGGELLMLKSMNDFSLSGWGLGGH